MALHHEMHSKNRVNTFRIDEYMTLISSILITRSLLIYLSFQVEHSVFADNNEATYKRKDQEEISLSFLGHIPHTESHPIDICPKFLRRSKSYCRSRERFREIEKSVESNGDLRNRIREGLHSYPPLTVLKSRQSTK